MIDGSNAGASNGFRIGGIKSGVSCTGNQTTIAGLAINHYCKRLTLINATFGDIDHHVGAFGERAYWPIKNT